MRRRIDGNDVIIILGAAVLVAGIGLLSIAAALIAAGVLIMAYGAVRDLLHGHD